VHRSPSDDRKEHVENSRVNFEPEIKEQRLETNMYRKLYDACNDCLGRLVITVTPPGRGSWRKMIR
jgi:hypothetical protein